MRIALLVPDVSGRYGSSRYALDLGKAFSAKGHSVLAIVAKTTGADWCEESRLLASDMRYLDFPWLAPLHALRVRRTLKYWKPDIVHSMIESYAQFIPWLGRRAKGYCVTMHGTYAVTPFEGKPGTRLRMIEAYRAADRVFAVSNFTKRYVRECQPALHDELGFEEKISVVRNAIDLSAIPPPPFRPARTGPMRIIGVGAVKDRKGYLQSIDAIAALMKRGTVDARYDIIGPLQDPGYAERLRTRIREHGLQDRVRLRGEISDEDLSAAYAGADAFLLLSQHQGRHVEGFGLVFLEASARGVPVIGPNTGGCPEAISEGKSGYVCDPHDAERVAERLEDILLRKTIMPGDCRAWAEEHDVRDAAETILKHYESLL